MGGSGQALPEAPGILPTRRRGRQPDSEHLTKGYRHSYCGSYRENTGKYTMRPSSKAHPIERRGRKASGLTHSCKVVAGLPKTGPVQLMPSDFANRAKSATIAALSLVRNTATSPCCLMGP